MSNSLPTFPAFDSYVCEGESVTLDHDGFTITATVEHDNDARAPWEADGHGPVSDWRDMDSKAAGELILSRDRDRARFYDFAGACRIARRDGWGTDDGQQPGETVRQYAARAARADFEVLKAWCADEWRFVGVCLSVEREGVTLTAEYAHALWGVECNYPGSDNSYLSDVAGQLLPEALDDARAILARLAA